MKCQENVLVNVYGRPVCRDFGRRVAISELSGGYLSCRTFILL